MVKPLGGASVAVEHAQIVESSHDAIVGMTRSGVVSSWNPAAALLYGHAAADIIGQSVQKLIPAAGRAKDAEILGRIISGEEVEAYCTDRVRGDGTVITVSQTISPIVDAVGVIVGAATVSRRAGDLQDARDRFEAHVDQQRTDAHEAADRFELDVDQQRVEANAAATRFEERVGQQRAEALDAADRFEKQVEFERAQAQDAQDRSQVRTDAEHAVTKSDTEFLRAQLQQNQRLEILGQLAGGVAHDFNNLLAVILNYAAFVVEELNARPGLELEGASHDVCQIQRAAERATALTHQLLAFARREVVRPRVLDLNHVVTDVEQLLHRTIGADIVLQTKLAKDLWPVMADPGQIEQVLVNLAVNARDAMFDGGTLGIDTANVIVDGEIIAAGSPLSAGRHVRLRVSDSGTGIPADVIDHVFEPFYTTKADGSGTGLGLATVYGIVVQAGAGIDIQSLPGQGTTFTIMIPVTDEPATPEEESAPVRYIPTGETVLIVEDEQALRDVTERIFIRGGYRVLIAANGAHAISLAAEHDGNIDLLVTDVVMPNMLGQEVAGKIRDIRPEIEVLYMSGYARPVLASQGRLGRDVHLIEKPFSATAIVEMAGQVLKNRPQRGRSDDAVAP